MRREGSILPAEARDVSAILVRARLAASALPGPPPGLPDDLGTAYGIQHHSIDRWPDTVAGWKVGGVPSDYVERFNETRLAGPIFSQTVVHATESCTASMPVFAGGFAAIEPEFVLRLGRTRDEDRLYIGAEIASSPIPSINDYGPIAVISDFGNNNGLLVGPEIEGWRKERQPVTVVCEIDGEQIASRDIPVLGENVEAAREFLSALSDKLSFDLPEGSLVSSGAITGVHEAQIGARSKLDFGRFGVLHLELTEAKPLV